MRINPPKKPVSKRPPGTLTCTACNWATNGERRYFPASEFTARGKMHMACPHRRDYERHREDLRTIQAGILPARAAPTFDNPLALIERFIAGRFTSRRVVAA